MVTNNSSNYSPVQHDVLLGDTNGGIKSLTNGASGTVLVSNGVGADPSWQTFAANVNVVRQVFTSSGTYTPTAGMVKCDIEVVGGGGGGGGAPSTTSSQGSVGSGGGAGGYAKGIFTAATIGVSQTVTIGAAGTAGNGSTPTNGGPGGTTSVGVLISATGGGGGGTSVASTSGGQGSGAGGAGAGGDFQCGGQSGGGGCWVNTGVQAFQLGGFGGSSFFGGGGNCVVSGAGGHFNGNNATSYGGGGGGGLNGPSQTAVNGGTGFKGIVIITEYIG